MRWPRRCRRWAFRSAARRGSRQRFRSADPSAFDCPTLRLSIRRSTTFQSADAQPCNRPKPTAALDASPAPYPRLAAPRLLEALADSPEALIHGPRRCGKTTLAQAVGASLGHACFSFDDDELRAAALADPAGFVGDLPERAILDEIQRVPALFAALKTAVDRRRTPGRFLLTGSANVLLLPQLADSLAGRMAILRLHPLAQCELARRPGGFIDALFAGLRKLQQAAGSRFAAGVVLYDGEASGAAFGDRLHAVAIRSLWEAA